MMGGKFELHTEPVEPADPTPGMHAVLRSERCVSCGECIRRCIYSVHERDADDPRVMAEPRSHRCRACIVCPQQCPRRALEVVWNPALERIGVPPYDADAVLTIWSEALDGKIPVRGAGYAGPFRGQGFDGIWTDMSEIVRPTRDGIHGREYISTEFDLGRKLPHVAGLRFDGDGRLQDRIPLTREIPVPVLFGRMPLGPGGLRVAAARVRAAMELKTFALMDLSEVRSLRVPVDGDEHDHKAVRYLRENRNHIALRLDDGDFDADGEPRVGPAGGDGEPVLPLGDVTGWTAVVELAGHSLVERAARLRERQRDLILVAEVPATSAAPEIVVELARGGLDAIHLACGWRGEWADGQGDEASVVEAIRASHLALVAAGIRDQLSLLVSGGIARAEHLPKSILLGADAVVIDVPLLVAMGCHVCEDCGDHEPCYRELLELDPRWGARRVVNLMAAWRNQLLEVLGAMGLREVRRLRGEVGRGLFADELEGAFFDDLVPLSGDDRPLALDAEVGTSHHSPYTALERMRNRQGLYLAQRGEGCVSCGTCATVCSRGVLRWPGGLLHPPPPVSEACVGPDCADDCVGACPEGALRITDDDRLQVVDHHRWTHRFIVENWQRAEGLAPVVHGEATTLGRSDGGFDQLRVVPGADPVDPDDVDLSIDLNRRDFGPRISIPFPWYGGGMSYGSISDYVMLGRAMAAAETGTFTCTGEGGYPEPLFDHADHVVTQIATGYFGVREETVQCARMVEFKYAQGAKPGL
ncbi:MAG: glutamate synthase-related protein, partial [Myxococcota bacterium]|nr:glutamate synthase-related protein [Myxococcota bacterium]